MFFRFRNTRELLQTIRPHRRTSLLSTIRLRNRWTSLSTNITTPRIWILLLKDYRSRDLQRVWCGNRLFWFLLVFITRHPSRRLSWKKNRILPFLISLVTAVLKLIVTIISSRPQKHLLYINKWAFCRLLLPTRLHWDLAALLVHEYSPNEQRFARLRTEVIVIN